MYETAFLWNILEDLFCTRNIILLVCCDNSGVDAEYSHMRVWVG